jgi:hypothetical protein
LIPKSFRIEFLARRREFITLLGGAMAWPLAARAQQADRVRRVVFLHALAEHDPEVQARIAAFRQGLETLGWIEKIAMFTSNIAIPLAISPKCRLTRRN